METRYIPGTPEDFVLFIKSKKQNVELKNIDGLARWVVTEDDITYIARPQDAENTD